VIKSFACGDTEKLFSDERVRRFQSFERQARKRLMVLHAAPSLEALMLNPGNRFHALKGERKGQDNMPLASTSSGGSVLSGVKGMRTV
jgi:proteic killer suppression protein